MVIQNKIFPFKIKRQAKKKKNVFPSDVERTVVYRSTFLSFSSLIRAGLDGSVRCASDWWSGGHGFDPRRVRQLSFMAIDHGIFSTVISPPSTDLRRTVVSFWRKNVHKSSRKTYLYNFDPLKPHFYIVKLGFTGVYIIFCISAQKHRLWVLVRTASPRRF